MVHDFNQMSCSDFPHVVLLGIILADFLVDSFTRFPDKIWFSGIIARSGETAEPNHDTFEMFIPENPSRTSPGCLFYSYFFPPGIKEADV